jgi:hydroxysqualene dehydroxylase
VSELTSALPASVRRDLIDPLCVAALNTPAEEASGRVFLRILRDALFAGAGSADLLLPRVSLSALMPDAAVRALPSATWHWRHRVASIAPASNGTWRVDDATHDAVVLACTSVESARLAQPLQPAWSVRAAALRFQSIVTVYAHHDRAQLHMPMIALDSDATRPAQFAFDHGRLTGQTGLLALVVSGANDGLEREGADAMARRAIAQLGDAMPQAAWVRSMSLVRVVTEKRATFACTPALERPGAKVCEGVWAAADYVDGPYPATLEGAVRSGEAAASGIHAMAAPQPRPVAAFAPAR